MMKFYEFFLFCLDKELVSNKANFRTFIEAFNKVSEGEDRIDFNKFTNLLTVVAKFLIPRHKRPIMMLLNDYLGDKTVSVSDRSKNKKALSLVFGSFLTVFVVQKARTIHRDDTNKRLLHTEIMNVYLKYETLLQDAYTLYFQTNYPRKKMVRKSNFTAFLTNSATLQPSNPLVPDLEGAEPPKQENGAP